MGQWLFHSLDPKATQRESTIGAFFASDAIESRVQAIIREGIQNALDAPFPKNGQIRVRIHLSGMEGALPWDEVQQYFDKDGIDHWNAPKNGLTESRPSFHGPCHYLVFEDFGTTGLEGDERVAHTGSDVKNHFYNFFRAEGQSDKDANNRGSWGVGKHVFPMYSTTKTFFGLTVRQTDGRQLLMGKTILRMHQIGESYYQDGYFGIRDNDDRLPFLPVSDENVLSRFKKVFRLKRDSEPGLSIVVPWIPEHEVEDNGNVALNCDRLALIAAREFYLPIVMGNLVVELECHDSSLRLDSVEAIRNVLQNGNHVFSAEESTELNAWLTVAEYAKKRIEDFTLIVPETGGRKNSWNWKPEIFGKDPAAIKETLSAMKEKLDAGQCVSIKIPLKLWKKGINTSLETFFHVFLLKNNTGKRSKTQCVRQEIMISNGARTSKDVLAGSKEYFSMIMVKEGSLATMLSDSENPSHTEWQHNQPKIRDAYATGIVTGMDFIKESAKQIAGILATADVEVDRTLLKDFFFVDLPELQNADQVAASPQPGVAAGDRTASSGPIPEPRKRAYVIERIDSGFRIKGVEDATTRLGTIQVETAYDVNKGNPFLKYDLNDFDMNKTLNVDPKKVGNLVKDKNKLTFTPSDRAFEVKVSGFDTNRQLIIKARKVASGNVMANNDTGNNQTEDDNDD